MKKIANYKKIFIIDIKNFFAELSVFSRFTPTAVK
ncbi:MAG TPA: hypothetical protein DHV15_04670 [Treponema sp.]|uniref:Uncharacterized protein n=1 Tax=Treponema denticola (strain ATCC 35405 / DSM 14222 / CIP 103919 / JCM 8153 / KCTC 15104) TaxID=243275 RepID=Q73KI1_TREDE|nr:hypothetical protein TDE_2237 [Treponema denticola ATCC 35405]HCY94793.1 hypothetical protein [Treponema sp.]